MRWARLVAVALAVPAAALWLAALTNGAPVWQTWLQAIAALLALATAGVIPEGRWAGLVGGGCLALLGAGVGLVWLIGLVTGAPRWLVWCDLGLALMVLAVAVGPLIDGFASWLGAPSPGRS
jgi:hypothetical protein